MNKQNPKCSGFALIEVIAVLILLGIVTALIATSGTSTDEFDTLLQAEVLKNHIRYAQKKAMNTNEFWSIEFDSATAYHLEDSSGTAAPLPYGDGMANTINLSGCTITITGTLTPASTISFNYWGNCSTCQGSTTTITVASSTSTVSRIYSLHRDTGYLE